MAVRTPFAQLRRYLSLLGITAATTLTASGASTLTGAVSCLSTLDVTGNVAVNTHKFTVAAASGNTVVAGTLAVTGVATFTADIAAAGGFKRGVVFTAPGALGVTAADQTNLDMRHSHTVTAYASGWVAPRAGSITALSASLSAAITGASKTLIVKATKNGTELGAALDLTFTTGGAETTLYAVAAKDSITFAAGDVIGLSYTSTTTTNTPALVADVEVEC